MTNIRKIIKETINRYINEELSVNAEVFDRTREIVTHIANECLIRENYDGNDSFNVNNINYSIPYMLFTNKISLTHKYNIIVYCKIYNFDSYDLYDLLWDKINLGSLSNKDFINVICFSFKKTLQKSLFSQMFSHELEHCYQINKTEKYYNNQSYTKAANIIKGYDKYNSGREFDICANIIYHLSKKEIDANINGLYNEIIDNKEQFVNYKITKILENSLVYKTYNVYLKNLLKELEARINDDEIIKAISYFGFTQESFLKWIWKQKKYFDDKLRKVSQKLFDDINSKKITGNNTINIKPTIIQ